MAEAPKTSDSTHTSTRNGQTMRNYSKEKGNVLPESGQHALQDLELAVFNT